MADVASLAVVCTAWRTRGLAARTLPSEPPRCLSPSTIARTESAVPPSHFLIPYIRKQAVMPWSRCLLTTLGFLQVSHSFFKGLFLCSFPFVPC